MLRMLLGVGLGPDVKNFSGQTPLHIAVEQGSRTVVSSLTEAGASLTIKDQDGATAPVLAKRLARRTLDSYFQYDAPWLDLSSYTDF